MALHSRRQVPHPPPLGEFAVRPGRWRVPWKRKWLKWSKQVRVSRNIDPRPRSTPQWSNGEPGWAESGNCFEWLRLRLFFQSRCGKFLPAQQCDLEEPVWMRVGILPTIVERQSEPFEPHGHVLKTCVTRQGSGLLPARSTRGCGDCPWMQILPGSAPEEGC